MRLWIDFPWQGLQLWFYRKTFPQSTLVIPYPISKNAKSVIKRDLEQFCNFAYINITGVADVADVLTNVWHYLSKMRKWTNLSFLFLSLLLIPSSTLPLLFLQVDVDVDVDVLVLGLVLASTGESPLLSFLLLSNCLHSSTPAPAPAPIFAFLVFLVSLSPLLQLSFSNSLIGL